MWQHSLTSVSRQSGPPSPRVRNVRRPAIINLFSPPPSLRHACPSFRLLRYEIETRGQIHVSVAQHLHVFLLCIKHQRAMSVLDLDLANGAEVAWQNSRCKQFQLLCYRVRSLLVGILTSLLLATCITRVNAVLIAAVNLVCRIEGGRH